MKLNVLRTVDRLTSGLKSLISQKDHLALENIEKVQKYLIEFQAHLKEIEHSKVISVFSLINLICPFLLSSRPSPNMPQSTLQLYLLNTLEIYTSTFTSTDSQTKKAYKILQDIFNKQLIAFQDPNFSDLFLQPYLINVLNSSSQYYTDASLILLKIFINLVKFQNSLVDEKTIGKSYYTFISGVKNNKDFSEGKFSTYSIVACDKFLNILEFAKESLTKFSETFNVVLETREKLKECFVLSLKFILNNSVRYSSLGVDPSQHLDQLFTNMLEMLLRFTNTSQYYQQFCDVPVILIHMILSDFEFLHTIDLCEKLKSCILSFLFTFYSEKFRKFPESIDIGMEDLLLSNFLFEQSTISQQSTWESLWSEVCNNLSHLDSLLRAISLNILSNLQNYSYLSSINQLLINLLSVNNKRIEEPAYFCFIYDLIQGLIKDQVDVTVKQMLFQILNFVFEFAELIPEHQIKVVNYFFFEIIPREPENCYFFAGILSNVLKMADQDTVRHTVSVVKINMKAEFVDLLMVAVSKLIITHDGMENMLCYLIRAGFTELCTLKMLQDVESDRIVTNWEETFELLKFIRIKSQLSFNFGFEEAVESFRSPKLEPIRQQIIEKTAENLISSIYCHKSKTLVIPKGLRLITEYISSSDANSEKLSILLSFFHDSQHFFLFVKNGFLSTILYYTHLHQSLKIWQNMTDYLIKSMQIEIDYKDFSTFLNLINTLKGEAKQTLLEILKDSLSMKNKNQSFSKCLIIPQPSPKEMKLSSVNVFKVFSVYVWVFAVSNCELITLMFNKEFFTIQIHNSKIQVKNSSVQVESDKIELSNWYLIVFTCNLTKTVKKFSLYLSTNSNLISRKDFTNKNNEGFDLQSIHFGGGNNDNKAMNRIKNFNLCNKVLNAKEVTELARLSWRYSILNFPVCKELDLKAIADIRDCLCLTWEEVIGILGRKSEIFMGSQIFDVVRAYCPNRMLVELCENNQNLKELFEIFNICERIICFSNYFYIVNEDFCKFLGYFFNKKPLDIRINEVFLDIMGSAPDEFNKILFESYISNQKSLFLLKQSKRLDEVIKKFIRIYPFCRINLVKFCKLLSGMNSVTCVAYLKKYFDKNTEKSEDELVSVLVHLIKIGNFFMIKCFLEVLLQDSVKMNENSKLFVVVLHIIDIKHDTDIQILVIKLICYKFDSEKKEEKYGKIVDLISQILPDQISKELFEFLLEEGFNSDKHQQEIQIALINIALNRVKNIQSVSEAEFLLDKLQKNADKILEFVYKNSNFPCWLTFAFKSLNYKLVLEKITKCIFRAVINKPDIDLQKLREFLAEWPDLDLYLSLLNDFSDFQLSKCFHFFCILWHLPRPFISENIEAITNILYIFRNSKPFMKVVEESYQVEYIKIKLDNSRNEKCLMLVGEILKFLLYLLKFDKTKQSTIAEFQNFVQSSHIQYLSKYYNTDQKSKEDCETIFSVFIFYYILKNYYKNPEIWSAFLETYIKKSQIFPKISRIMNENMSTSLFYKIFISKNTAIIPLSGHDPTITTIEELDNFCFGLNYDLVRENSKICENLYSTQQTPILVIVEKNNYTWSCVFNCIQAAVKNYISIDKKWKTDFFLSDSEYCELFESSSIQMLLKNLLNDSWHEVFDEDLDKERFKIEYDLLRYSKILMRSQRVINHSRFLKIKIRQCYDKCYRWVFLKPDIEKSRKNVTNPLLSKAKTEILFDDMNFPSFIHATSEPNSIIFDFSQQCSKYFSCSADYIKIQGTCFGRISISKTFFEFFSSFDYKPVDPLYYFSSLEFSMVLKRKRHMWSFSEISEIVLKKFIHQPCSFEVLLKSGKSYLFNVFSEDIRKEIVQRFSEHKHILVYGKNPHVEVQKFTKEWKKNKINNFEYLMIVNKLASRCMHDISQYPVFPWLLADYSKEVQYLEDSGLRDLHYPIGAQNEKFRENGIKKYIEWGDDSLTKFIFGSHYSNGGIVLHYLIRLEPYTSQAKELQNGDFDVGDRLFFSLDNAWKSTQASSGDYKELIPELFYQPWCLYSYSSQIYGKTQTNQEIIHLQVPNCAVSNWDFIKKHRILLDSPAISQNLHAWIDLIFGCKQQGEKALQHCNIFCGDTYEQSFNIQKNSVKDKNLQSMIEKVYHFGQTPSLLFVNFHAKKEENGYLSENGLSKYLAGELEMGVQEKGEKIKGIVVAAFVLKKTAVMVKRQENNFYILSIKIKGLEDNNLSTEYCLKRLAAWDSEQLSVKCSNIKYSNKSFAVFREKFLISALHLSNSVIVHNMKGELVQTLYFHTSLTITVASSENFIFSGGLDSTIGCWNFSESNLFSFNKSFIGHNSPVLTIKVLESYCVLVSGSQDGLILIHDFRNSECLVKILQPCEHLDVSELGFIGCSYKNTISFFHITGENIYKELMQKQITEVKFTPLGEYCIIQQEDKIIIKDPTDQRLNGDIGMSKILVLDFHPQDKYIAIWKSVSDNETTFCTVKYDNRSAKRLIRF